MRYTCIAAYRIFTFVSAWVQGAAYRFAGITCSSAFLLLLAGLATPTTAIAQGPWVGSAIPGSPAPGTRSIMVPSAQVVWGTYIVPSGRLSAFTVFCSTNGGQSFQQQRLASSNEEINDVWGLDGLKAWAIRSIGTSSNLLLATTTGPAGFSTVTSAPSATLLYVRFLNATTGILVAQPATNATTWPFFRTNDGGTTWTSISTLAIGVAGDYPTQCIVVNNVFWVSTHLGYVLRSTDEGQTWTSADTGLGTGLREVSFRNALNGLAFGTTGQLRRTVDGGQTWTMVTPQGPLRLTKAVAVEGSAGTYLSVTGEWFSAQNGTSISTDDGVTWVEVEASINMQRLASGPGGVYGTGFPLNNNSTNTLYRYSGPLSTRTKQQDQPAFAFPNPTTGVVNLPTASETRTVRLYDAVGRLQRTWKLGRAEKVLHLDGVAPGVYQLHLSEQNQAVRVQQIVIQH